MKNFAVICSASFILYLVTHSTVTRALVKNDLALDISIELSEFKADGYHEPYVAVWLETDDRKPVATLAMWYRAKRGEKWLKDVRQWWRKIGSHSMAAVDSVTGATKKHGTYKINWNGFSNDGKSVSEGEYVLHVEAVREKGGREHIRLPISLPLDIEKLIF